MVNFYPTDFGPHPGMPPGASPEGTFDTDIRFVSIRAPREQGDFLDYLGSLPVDVHVGRESILRTYHDWGYHPEIERDARLGDAGTLDEIAAAPLPDFMAQVRPAELAAEVDVWHVRGYPVMASPPHLGGQLFETAMRLRGFERFLVDLATDPPLVDYLLDQLTAMHLAMCVALTRAGIDILALDDDVAEPRGMLISPAMWRRSFGARWRAIIDACRRVNPELMVFWHCDGNFEAIIPDLIDVGVDIVNPLQPDVMDVPRLAATYGDRLTFFGTVGTARLWAWGTPEAIRDEVRERITTVGRGGGLIIAPAYDLEPAGDIPWANVVAFFEAVQAFGGS
jgi:uroporphyrinogen decarboxylase